MDVCLTKQDSGTGEILSHLSLSLSLSGIVNEKLLSDYLHHVFPCTKQTPAPAPR